MKEYFKPGMLLWCAEGGAVIQVEVTTFQRDDLTATRIKHPNDDVMRPWRCWDGYLFKSRKAAVRKAVKQLQEQIDNNNIMIEDLKNDNKNLENDIKQLQQELT